MGALDRIAAGLGRLDPLTAPEGAKSSAALALLRPVGADDLEVTLTRRRRDLPTHPGQISFPGGRREPGESIRGTALREAGEEIGLDPASVTVLGEAPAFYIAPSRFWLSVVVARWDAPHQLVPQPSEVDAVLTARFSELADPSRWRRVALSSRGASWAWALGDGDVLWGATGVTTSVLMDLAHPDWSGGLAIGDLGPEVDVEPWTRTEPVPRPSRPRLAIDGAASELVVAEVAEAAICAPSDRITQLPPAARAMARAIACYPSDGSVTVLVGPGGTGDVGLAAAAALAGDGRTVRVVGAGDLGARADAARSAGVEVVGPEVIPAADGLVVDALVGRGLDGPLRGAVRRLVRELSSTRAPILSVDVPSGLHPEQALIGELVAATVTVSIGRPPPGVLADGMAPFIGDLWIAPAGTGELIRVVADDRGRTWRE